jgi:hypothetical protein
MVIHFQISIPASGPAQNIQDRHRSTFSLHPDTHDDQKFGGDTMTFQILTLSILLSRWSVVNRVSPPIIFDSQKFDPADNQERNGSFVSIISLSSSKN